MPCSRAQARQPSGWDRQSVHSTQEVEDGGKGHRECWVWERGQSVRLHPRPQFLRLLSEVSGPPPPLSAQVGRQGFQLWVSQVTLDPSRSSKSWQGYPSHRISAQFIWAHAAPGRPWKQRCTSYTRSHTLPCIHTHSHTSLTYSHLHTHTPMYSTYTHIHTRSSISSVSMKHNSNSAIS